MGANEVIQEYLRRHGPASSSSVNRVLASGGLGDSAARKAIERASPPIRKLAGIRLPNRQRVMYLEDQFGRGRFWDQLISVLDEAGSIYGTALAGLQAYGGSIPEQHFAKLSGAPHRLRGQVGAERVLQVLRTVGLLESQSYVDIGAVVRLAQRTSLDVQPLSLLRARLVSESILLAAVADWLRKNGMVSYGKVACRDGSVLPTYASFDWDLTAPTYLRPIATRSSKGVAPGFVVADVILSEEITQVQAQYFLRKCWSVANRRSVRPSLALFITAGYSPAALKLGRSEGLVFTTPSLLLGHEVGAALLELIQVLGNAAAHASARPEVVAELFGKLGRIEGAAGNLRGPLFEMIVAHATRETEGGSVDIGVDAVTSEGAAEIDVLLVKGRQGVRVYECKGYSAGKAVSASEVERWLGVTIPRVRAWLQSQSRFGGATQWFEFWTTGTLSPDAEALLKTRAAETQRYSIGWRDGSAVEEYVAKLRNRRLTEVLREQYRSHVLAQI